ncbi:hypothetical protein BESB_028630 [Besnoitia besnoiti]|uniref:Uncharacterized protein n=1 Tax=Besnoitia besnoiti TaxID=94643 RepID=A0A2A9LY98_BESBE|nr:uncharacterized protein BESB_028630 [Besnoitia besnoiti]PFH31428.1 hypothetical protein BESB_028630 [Besnoitia besnoiti]
MSLPSRLPPRLSAGWARYGVVSRPLQGVVNRRAQLDVSSAAEDGAPLFFPCISVFSPFSSTANSFRAARTDLQPPSKDRQRPPVSAKRRARPRVADAEDLSSASYGYVERFKRADFDSAAWREESRRKEQSDGWHVVTTRILTPSALEFDRQVFLPEFSRQATSELAAARDEGGERGLEDGTARCGEAAARGEASPKQLSRQEGRLGAGGAAHVQPVGPPRLGRKRRAQDAVCREGREGAVAPPAGSADGHRGAGSAAANRDDAVRGLRAAEDPSVDAQIAASALKLREIPPPPVTYFDRLTEFSSESDRAARGSSVAFPYLPGPPPPSRFFTHGKEDWRYQWRREDDEDEWRKPDLSLGQAATGRLGGGRGGAQSGGVFDEWVGGTSEVPVGLERKQLSVFLLSRRRWKPVAILNSHELLFALQHPEAALHPGGQGHDSPPDGAPAQVALAHPRLGGQGYPLMYWRQLLTRLQRIAFSFDGPSLLAATSALAAHLAAVRSELDAVQVLLSREVFSSAEKHLQAKARELQSANGPRASEASSGCYSSPSSVLGDVAPECSGTTLALAEEAATGENAGSRLARVRPFGDGKGGRGNGDEDHRKAEALERLTERAEELNGIILALTQQALWKRLSGDLLPHLPFLPLSELASLAEAFALLSPKLASSLNVVVMQAMEQLHSLSQPHLHSAATADFHSSARALFRLLDACAEAILVSCFTAGLLNSPASRSVADLSPGGARLPFLSSLFNQERFDSPRKENGPFAAAGVVGALSSQLFDTVAAQGRFATELLQLPPESRARLVVHASLYWQGVGTKPATRQLVRRMVSSLVRDARSGRLASSSPSSSWGVESSQAAIVRLFALLRAALVPRLSGFFPPLEGLHGLPRAEAKFPYSVSSCLSSSPLPLAPSPSCMPLVAAVRECGLESCDAQHEPVVADSLAAAPRSSPVRLSFFKMLSEDRHEKEGARAAASRTEESCFSPSEFACLVDALGASLVLRPSAALLSLQNLGAAMRGGGRGAAGGLPEPRADDSGFPSEASKASWSSSTFSTVPHASLASCRLSLPARECGRQAASAELFKQDEADEYAYLQDLCVDASASPSSQASPVEAEGISVPLTTVLSLQRVLGEELGTLYRLMEGVTCTDTSQAGRRASGEEALVASSSAAATASERAPEESAVGVEDPLLVLPRLLSLFACSTRQQVGPLSFQSLVHALHSQTAALRFAAAFQLCPPRDEVVGDVRGAVTALKGRQPPCSTPLASFAPPETSAGSESLPARARSSCLSAPRVVAWSREIGACLTAQLAATSALLRRLTARLSLALAPIDSLDSDGQGGAPAYARSSFSPSPENVFAEEALEALLQNSLGCILYSVNTAAAAVRECTPPEQKTPNVLDSEGQYRADVELEFETEAFQCMSRMGQVLAGKSAADASHTGSAELSDALRRLSLATQASWLRTLLTLLELRAHRQGQGMHYGQQQDQKTGEDESSRVAELLDESARVLLFIGQSVQHRARLFGAPEVFLEEESDTSLAILEAVSVFSHFATLRSCVHAGQARSPLPTPVAEGRDYTAPHAGSGGHEGDWLAESLQLVLDDVREGLVHASPAQLRRAAAAVAVLVRSQARLRGAEPPLRKEPSAANAESRDTEKADELDGGWCQRGCRGERCSLPWEEVLTGLRKVPIQRLVDELAASGVARDLLPALGAGPTGNA